MKVNLRHSFLQCFLFSCFLSLQLASLAMANLGADASFMSSDYNDSTNKYSNFYSLDNVDILGGIDLRHDIEGSLKNFLSLNQPLSYNCQNTDLRILSISTPDNRFSLDPKVQRFPCGDKKVAIKFEQALDEYKNYLQEISSAKSIPLPFQNQLNSLQREVSFRKKLSNTPSTNKKFVYQREIDKEIKHLLSDLFQNIDKLINNQILDNLDDKEAKNLSQYLVPEEEVSSPNIKAKRKEVSNKILKLIRNMGVHDKGASHGQTSLQGMLLKQAVDHFQSQVYKSSQLKNLQKITSDDYSKKPLPLLLYSPSEKIRARDHRGKSNEMTSLDLLRSRVNGLFHERSILLERIYLYGPEHISSISKNHIVGYENESDLTKSLRVPQRFLPNTTNIYSGADPFTTSSQSTSLSYLDSWTWWQEVNQSFSAGVSGPAGGVQVSRNFRVASQTSTVKEIADNISISTQVFCPGEKNSICNIDEMKGTQWINKYQNIQERSPEFRCIGQIDLTELSKKIGVNEVDLSLALKTSLGSSIAPVSAQFSAEGGRKATFQSTNANSSTESLMLISAAVKVPFEVGGEDFNFERVREICQKWFHEVPSGNLCDRDQKRSIAQKIYEVSLDRERLASNQTTRCDIEHKDEKDGVDGVQDRKIDYSTQQNDDTCERFYKVKNYGKTNFLGSSLVGQCFKEEGFKVSGLHPGYCQERIKPYASCCTNSQGESLENCDVPNIDAQEQYQCARGYECMPFGGRGKGKRKRVYAACMKQPENLNLKDEEKKEHYFFEIKKAMEKYNGSRKNYNNLKSLLRDGHISYDQCNELLEIYGLKKILRKSCPKEYKE